jgi:hypothetical protein
MIRPSKHKRLLQKAPLNPKTERKKKSLLIMLPPSIPRRGNMDQSTIIMEY